MLGVWMAAMQAARRLRRDERGTVEDIFGTGGKIVLVIVILVIVVLFIKDNGLTALQGFWQDITSNL